VTGWTLRLRQPPALRLDLRGLTPSSLGALAANDVERTRIGHGNALQPLAEFFTVAPRRNDDALVFEGDLSRCDRVGWQMDGGRLIVDGAAGDYAGACMSAGEIIVWGDAGALAGCEMAGGTLTIEGSVGEFAASTLPGSMDGMRGGSLTVRGSAGARLADRMRRGTVVVFGDVGDFFASRLVAGTLAVGGQPGAHGGYAMRRGSIVFATAVPAPSPTFVPAIADVPVFWQLLARDLARHGGPFASLPARAIDRHLGDLAADGKGEWIVAR
jgi:formylmethanofuran dehydrogenase subunit C